MPPTPLPQPSESQTAERIFAAYLTELDLGAAPDFGELRRRHPAQADELARLHGDWLRAHGLLGRAGLDGAPPVDPDGAIAARGADDSSSRFSAEVLRRLAGRSAASGRYRVLGEIAHGGMGQVLRVWDEDLRRNLAMKVILGGAGGPEAAAPIASARSMARFLDEAQVAAQLDHPGIVPVHELGLDADGRVYFTMKLVEGRTLEEVCEELAKGEGGWTQTRVVGLLQRVCEAMAYAHSKGVIHRDLKPRNVMVGSYGQVYVMDWGLAKVLARAGEGESESMRARVDTDRTVREAEEGSSLSLSETGAGLGTPGYMAPEQRAGRWSDVGPHSDVYSVGGMLARLLTGQRPADQPRPVSQAAPDTPAELASICDKAMAPDWRARYRDMSELSEDLLAYIEDRVVRAYPTGPWLEARKWVRRNRALAASLAAGLLATLVGLGGYAVQSQRTALAERNRAEQERAARAETYMQSAERSALRGDWKQALEELERSRSEGNADEVRVLVREAEAYSGLANRRLCNEILDRIDALGTAGGLAGKVELLRGDLAMSSWKDSALAAAYLERARDLGLGPADAAYVDGLLSDSSEEALAYFEEALACDPFHHRALGAKAMLEVFLGRLSAARDSARTMAAKFPDDPAPPTVEAVVLAAEGRFDDADEVCRGIARRHGEKTALLTEVCINAYRTLALLGPDAWYGEGSEWTPLCALPFLPLLSKMARSSDLAEIGFAGPGPNLPCLHAGLNVFVGNFLAPSSPQVVADFEAAFQNHPDGLLEYWRATKLITLPRTEGLTKLDTMLWSAEAFGRAGRTPSFVPAVQRAARFWRIRCLDWVKENIPASAPEVDLRPEIEYFLHVEPRSVTEDSWMTWISSRNGDYDLARTFARAWRERVAPDDRDPDRSLAQVELLDGRPAVALELLDPLLLASPSDEGLIALRKQAVTALEESLRRFGS